MRMRRAASGMRGDPPILALMSRRAQPKVRAVEPGTTATARIAQAYLEDPARPLSELADRYCVSRQAVSAMLKRAEEVGLIPQRPSAIKAERRARDHGAVSALLAMGAPVAEVAAQTGLSPKQVYRLISVDGAVRGAYEAGREQARRLLERTIGRIRITIAWRGLTEAAAAEAVGLTPGALSQILTGRMALHPEIVDRLAASLAVPLGWLRHGSHRPRGMPER
jgi:hypothetical protein